MSNRSRVPRFAFLLLCHEHEIHSTISKITCFLPTQFSWFETGTFGFGQFFVTAVPWLITFGSTICAHAFELAMVSFGLVIDWRISAVVVRGLYKHGFQAQRTGRFKHLGASFWRPEKQCSCVSGGLTPHLQLVSTGLKINTKKWLNMMKDGIVLSLGIELGPGWVLIMDNTPSHKTKKALGLTNCFSCQHASCSHDRRSTPIESFPLSYVASSLECAQVLQVVLRAPAPALHFECLWAVKSFASNPVVCHCIRTLTTCVREIPCTPLSRISSLSLCQPPWSPVRRCEHQPSFGSVEINKVSLTLLFSRSHAAKSTI